MATPVVIHTASVPKSFCHQDWQTTWPFLVGLLTGTLTNLAGVNYGPAAPAAEDLDKPWVRTNADGSPDRTYVFNQGFWLSRHASPPGVIDMWDGVGDIAFYDGGEDDSVSAYTGPFWEIYSAMAARIPIGVGTLPGGGVIAVGTEGGEENHLLTINELPEHTHKLLPIVYGANGNNGGGNNAKYGTLDQSQVFTDFEGGDETHNNMPPYSGVYFIRRTARLFYRI